MGRRSCEQVVVDAIAQQRRRAVAQGVCEHVVDEAGSATRRALSGARGSERWLMSRVEGYFWTVVRRRLVRARSHTNMTARFVLAAVVEDLSASGRDGDAVWSEIERGWADRVPSGVLEEYRARLTA